MDATARTFRYLDDDEVAAQRKAAAAKKGGRNENRGAASGLESHAAALVLAGCSGEEFGDLKAELNGEEQGFRGPRHDPLPQVKPYEPVPYTAEGVVDPFRPDRIDVARGAARARAANLSKMAPGLQPAPKSRSRRSRWNRCKCSAPSRRTGRRSRWSRPDPNLYRIKKGNYLGLNFGIADRRSTKSRSTSRSWCRTGRGEWVERASALQLLEIRKMNSQNHEPFLAEH